MRSLPLTLLLAQRAHSLDHLVGASEHRCWHFKAERLRGLVVDEELVFGRRLHRQIGRLLTPEDAIDVVSSTPELVGQIRPVGDQAAADNAESSGVHRGQLVLGRKRDNEIPISRLRRTWRDYRAAIRASRERRKGALDLAGLPRINRAQLHSE